ncbi:MAG: transcription antitermination factor NusB [Candidatus Wallbacteria bacterium]|nr:transcription antitermination factor NusB [Candidatus Wallbacteria bacterium]
MKKRRKARILAMHCLYQYDLVGGSIEEIFEETKKNFRLERDISAFSWNITRHIIDDWQKLNAIISKYSDNWDLERMCSVDRALLRIGVAELLYFPESPVSVTINEAVEIAKAYSTDNSCSFINALLDKISRELVPEKER